MRITHLENVTEATHKAQRTEKPSHQPRISIASSYLGTPAEIKPRLKSGVHINRAHPDQDKSLIVAIAQRAISISHPGARAIIAKFDGEHTANDISQELQAPVEVIEQIIAQLISAQFLDITKSKIKLHNRFQSTIAQRAAQTEDQSNDAFFRQLQLRMAPELSQTTWVENIVDGGVELLSDRQNFGIEIYGNNRVATLIYAGLLASGVSNTKFSLTSRREKYAIGDEDLGTGILRVNDFGQTYKSRLEELAREWSLFPTASKIGKTIANVPIPERNLRVIVGNFAPDLIEQIMRDGLDHFFVGQLIGGAAYCGPLVIPAKTPCYNCIELSRSEQYGMDHLIPLTPISDEPPVAMAYQLAGSAIQTIVQFIDTGKCELVASQLLFDYLCPSHGEPTRFSRHPKCACVWS